MYRKSHTHFMLNNIFPNCAIYEIVWKSKVQPHRQQTQYNKAQALACWITKAENM